MLILPLFARRALPRSVTVVVALLCAWQLTVVSGPILGDVAVVVVVHAAAAHVRARWWGITTWAVAVCGAGLGAVVWFGADAPGLAMVGFAAGFGAVSAAYLLGARQLDRREHVEEQLAALEERNRLLAVERDQRAEMAAARERTTIARELHDIVAHSLTVIVVQADGAAAAVRAAPDRADIAPLVLDTIAATSREALAEMRRLVGVLRSGASPGAVPFSGSVRVRGAGSVPVPGSVSRPGFGSRSWSGRRAGVVRTVARRRRIGRVGRAGDRHGPRRDADRLRVTGAAAARAGADGVPDRARRADQRPAARRAGGLRMGRVAFRGNPSRAYSH